MQPPQRQGPVHQGPALAPFSGGHTTHAQRNESHATARALNNVGGPEHTGSQRPRTRALLLLWRARGGQAQQMQLRKVLSCETRACHSPKAGSPRRARTSAGKPVNPPVRV